jgi:hypothetical protein
MSSGFSYLLPMNESPATLYRVPVKRRRRGIDASALVRPGSLRLILFAPTVLGLALVTAACGGGSPNVGVASVSTTRTTRSAPPSGSSSGGKLGQLASCMRSHGVVSFPDSASFGSSAGIKAATGQIEQVTQSEAASPTFQAARRACAKYFPPIVPTQHVSTQEMQKLLAVSRCMRAHGVSSFPDPDPTTGELSTPVGIDRNSPVVVAALQACQSLGRAAGLGTPNTGPCGVKCGDRTVRRRSTEWVGHAFRFIGLSPPARKCYPIHRGTTASQLRRHHA